MIQVAPIDPNEFSTLNANAHQFYAQQNPTQQNPTASKGSFLTRLLPTIDSIGGGAAGAAIGTALLPGIGTLIGAGLGSAIGGGGGKVAENAAEGNKLTSGVAGEAALNGVLGAGPLRLGKFGVDAIRGGLAAKAAGNSIADALANAGTNAANMSITKAVGNKLSKSGENLIAKEFRLNPTQQANFAKLHGEEATSVLRRYGVKSPEDVQAKIQPLQDAFDSVITNIPDVSKNDLAAGLKKVYQPLIKSPALFEQGLGKSVKQQSDELLKLAKGGSLPADKVNELRKTFDAAVNYTQKGAPEYNVIKKTADALRGTLQSAADKAGVKTPEGLSFKEVGKELRKLYGLDDIVGKQAYLGTGNLPFSLGNTPGTVIGSSAGPLGAAAGYVGNALVNSPTGRRALANGTLKAGEKLTEKATAVNPFGAKAIATRVGGAGLADALIGQSLPKNMAQPATTSTTSMNMPTAANMPPLNQTNDNLSSTLSAANDPFSVDNIRTNVQKLLQTGANDKAIQSYLSIAGTMQQLEAAAAKTPQLNATQQQQANNAVSGLSDLQTLAQEIQNDPSVLVKDAIPGGGIARRLTGTSNYEAAKQNVVDVIARLRSGAAITQDEANRYMGLLPGATDTPQIASQKLQRLYGLLSSFASPQPAQVGAADLASALGI